ncbi:MAG: NUDIX hydrolase [Clostridiales Family XIII bacterium]|jgi:ADP-ribose pyrophosphatase YjhB (NUDIX family)|nr:NUDIX hydrolase [Clostridiales Family XIII bacterium]
MWTGGVRVIIQGDAGKILLVRQSCEQGDIWMLPGGAIEDGENASRAAERETFEETGLVVKIGALVWHVEETSSKRGQRFVNFFLAEIAGGAAVIGSDPEFDSEHQVLRDLKFFSRKEIHALPRVYPPMLRDEVWEVLAAGGAVGDVFRVREG